MWLQEGVEVVSVVRQAEGGGVSQLDSHFPQVFGKKIFQQKNP